MFRGMARYHEPGDPIELSTGDGEQMLYAEVFFPEREPPMHMDVSATDKDAARAQVIRHCGKTFAGFTHPPSVAVFELDEYASR
jgi:hypothetical protein